MCLPEQAGIAHDIRLLQESANVGEVQIDIIDLIEVSKGTPQSVGMAVHPPRAGRQGLGDQIGQPVDGMLRSGRDRAGGGQVDIHRGR